MHCFFEYLGFCMLYVLRYFMYNQPISICLSSQKFFGRHHDLVDRIEISMSQMIIDILFCSYICFFPLLLQILLPYLTVYMSNTAVTLSEAVSANSSRAPAFPIGFLVWSVLLPFFMLSYYVSLRSEFHVMMSDTISAYKRVCVTIHVLFTLVVFVCIQCC